MALDADPMALVRGYDADELAIAGEFLTTWLPFLSDGLCPSCSSSLRRRVASLLPPPAEGSPQPPSPKPQLRVDQVYPTGWDSNPAAPLQHLPFEASGWDSDPPSQQQQQQPQPPQQQPQPRKSWADITQEEEDAAAAAADDGDEGGEVGRPRVKLTREQRELHRFRNVVRKKDFMCFERVKGRLVNILGGLELHTGVFSAAEQKRIVECVYDFQEKGKRGELGDRTYTEPEKWMRGKGRVTIQFGCCYNYATDKNGNPPGIIRTFASDPIPELFKVMIKRMIRWHVLPPDCVPDSCIVNIYDPEDCIPPHIDSHDFVRPFCTVSFLSECNILFGSSLKIAGPGEFIGSFAIPLPVGSVLVINGNSADVAKHCVPAVPSKRISITFRKMDPAKRPFGFKDDPELLNIPPLEAAPQETSRSSDEGKRKEFNIKNKNPGSRASRSKKSRGKTSAGNSGWGILGDEPPQHLHVPTLSESSERERDYIGRSREPRHPRGDVPGMQSLMDRIGEQPNMQRQERMHGHCAYSVENGTESYQGGQRMEHRQMRMINRTINNMDSVSLGSNETSDQPRISVRTVSNKPRTRVYMDG